MANSVKFDLCEHWSSWYSLYFSVYFKYLIWFKPTNGFSFGNLYADTAHQTGFQNQYALSPLSIC